MLIKHRFLELIRSGEIELLFRKWKRPTVKSGGRLRTSVGVLAIEAVDEVSESGLKAKDAERAGYESKAALIAELSKREGTLYRIQVSYLGADERGELRADTRLANWAVAEPAWTSRT